MELPRGIVADSCVTVDATCRVSCEVLDEHIEFRFGDHNGGLHLYFDWPGFLKFVTVQSLAIERLGGQRGSFVVGDDDD